MEQQKKLRILNVYAPNDPTDSGAFWKNIPNEMERKHLPNPDVMLGDFNTVEDSLDRLPNKSDNAETVRALREMRTNMNLIDGWRTTHPTQKDYTHFAKGHGTYSRLDRIYTTTKIHETATDWKIEQPIIKTDHMMISARLTNPKMPYIGEGRWTMQTHIIKNKKFLDTTIKRGIKFETKVENIPERTEKNNIQIEYKKFKDDLVEVTRQIAKEDTENPQNNRKTRKREEKDTKQTR